MITVLKSGLLTTVQDLGRIGYQRDGVVVAGAVDGFAARVANMLVGNPDNAALLELALIGPELRFKEEALLSWCGGEFEARIDGQALPKDRPVRVPAGATVNFGPARKGAMAWLAVAGGFDVPVLLGSRSTLRRAHFGGHEGRGLIPGDRLGLLPPSERATALLAALRGAGRLATGWCVKSTALGHPAEPGVLRFIRGPEWDWFTRETHHLLETAEYTVTKDADRMGLRLDGPPLRLAAARELLSSAVNTGVVQVPPSGLPIVLSAARQTVGGYPRIAVVAAVDFSAIAQLRPGETVRFREIPLARAHELYIGREQDLNRVRTGLARLSG
ncbi:MAG: biotin-dependent carboxyltransferase family protein [Opitutales bacterium]